MKKTEELSTIVIVGILLIVAVPTNLVSASSEPELAYSPQTNDFEYYYGEHIQQGDILIATFEIWNGGSDVLTWEICAGANAGALPGLIPNRRSINFDLSDWISASPTTGSSTGPDDWTEVTITIDTSELVGFYSGYICIYSNDPDSYTVRPKGAFPDDNFDSCLPQFAFSFFVGLCDPNEHYDMTIITTEYLKSSYDPLYNLEELAEAHEVYDGLSVKIKTVEEIYDEYAILSHLNPIALHRSKALAIRSFIQDMNRNCGTMYGLLVGDDNWEMDELVGPGGPIQNSLPSPLNKYWKQYKYYLNSYSYWIRTANIEDKSRGEYDYDGYNGSSYGGYNVEVPTFQIRLVDFIRRATIIDGNTHEIIEDDFTRYAITAPSDMPYACLDGEGLQLFHDGEEICGPNDMGFVGPSGVRLNDFSVEMYVGRAPCSCRSEVVNFVKKTLEVIKDPADDFDDVLVLGKYLGMKSRWTPKDASGLNCRHAFSTPYISQSIDTYEPAVDDPSGFGLTTAGIPSDTDHFTALFDQDLAYYDDIGNIHGFWDSNDVVSLINQGKADIITFMGHSDRDSIWLSSDSGELEHQWVQGYSHILDDSDFDNNLKSNIKFIYSNGCYGGAFDFPESECMGEKYLTGEYGAVSGIWNTLPMWGDVWDTTRVTEPTPNAEDYASLNSRMFWHNAFGGINAELGSTKYKPIGSAFGKSEENLRTNYLSNHADSDIVSEFELGLGGCAPTYFGFRHAFGSNMILLGDPALRLKLVETPLVDPDELEDPIDDDDEVPPYDDDTVDDDDMSPSDANDDSKTSIRDLFTLLMKREISFRYFLDQLFNKLKME